MKPAALLCPTCQRLSLSRNYYLGDICWPCWHAEGGEQ